MEFISTRGFSDSVGFTQAVAQGLAPDGGLYLPKSFPDLSPNLKKWEDLAYDELCFEFFKLFATDMNPAILKDCVNRAYSDFSVSEVAPIVSLSDQWKINVNSSLKHFEAINMQGSMIDNYKNNYTFDNQSSLSTIIIFGEIIHQFESELRKIIENIENHYCGMTKFDDKIIIRCIANDNYDLKKTLNFIMKNIIHDKLPKSWDL